MMRRSGLAAIAASAAIAALLFATRASADETSAARRATAAREMNRPHTMAELSTGFLALPAADVCIKSLTDCSRGEFSVAVGLDNFYRFRSFALGAGIEWATTVRNDAAGGAPELEREHSRRYFLVAAKVRYYFLRIKAWELWGGATLGGVVVRDAWSVFSDRNPYADTDLVGPRAATIGTEGLAAGAGFGAEWSFAPNWSFGTKLLYSSWFFPRQPKTSPTLDFASLSGRVDMFSVGFIIAYRIAL
jgi:hypothetical protein